MAVKKSLLIVGCGDIGGGVAAHFLALGWRVMGLRRNIDALPVGVEGISADICLAEDMARLRGLKADYVLMTLTPANYRPEGYEVVFEQGLDHVLQAIEAPKHVFLSAVLVYMTRQIISGLMRAARRILVVFPVRACSAPSSASLKLAGPSVLFALAVSMGRGVIK